jgi:hypothetical protein
MLTICEIRIRVLWKIMTHFSLYPAHDELVKDSQTIP